MSAAEDVAAEDVATEDASAEDVAGSNEVEESADDVATSTEEVLVVDSERLLSIGAEVVVSGMVVSENVVEPVESERLVVPVLRESGPTTFPSVVVCVEVVVAADNPLVG